MIKTSAIILFLITSSFISNPSPDFEWEYRSIERKIEENLYDKDELDQLSRKAETLESDIEYYLKNHNDELEPAERQKCKQYQKFAEDLHEYIETIGDLDNGNVTIEAARRITGEINGSMATLPKGKMCLDLYEITIGKYSATLLGNSSGSMLKIEWKYASTDKMASGNFSGAIWSNSLKVWKSTREDKKYRLLKITSLKCLPL